MPLISVVICTYNRADLLADVLQTVCKQTLAASAYEVIIVDNNSSDRTPLVGNDFAARYPNVRYCMESQQGLSHARNRGWHEARGEYVAYLDDDCKTPPTWLTVAQSVIEQVAPDIFGGPYFAFYNRPKPTWFKDEYGSWSLGVKEALHVAPDILHGGNLFLRRNLLSLTGGFDPALGMKGQQLAYGEETALLRRIHTMRPATSFYYEPRLFVYHLVRPEKLSLWWQWRSTFMHGCAYYPIYEPGQRPFPKWIGLLLPFYTLLICIRTLLQSLLWRDRKRYPTYQNYLYESPLLSYRVHRLGVWWAYTQTLWLSVLSRIHQPDGQNTNPCPDSFGGRDG